MFLTNIQLQTEVVQLRSELTYLNKKYLDRKKLDKDIFYLRQAVKELKKERKELLGRIKLNQTSIK